VLSASVDNDAISGMSSPEVLDPPTSGTLVATVLEGRGVGVVVSDHSAATAAMMTPQHGSKLSASKSSPALHTGSDSGAAHRVSRLFIREVLWLEPTLFRPAEPVRETPFEWPSTGMACHEVSPRWRH
jgi:hypothetical protein